MKEPGGIRLLSCSKKDQRYNEKERKQKNKWRSVSKKRRWKKTARSGMSEHLGKWNSFYMYTEKKSVRYSKGWRRPLERDTNESMEDSKRSDAQSKTNKQTKKKRITILFLNRKEFMPTSSRVPLLPYKTLNSKKENTGSTPHKTREFTPTIH